MEYILKKKISKQHLIYLLSVVGIFSLFSIPSLKLIYSSALINLIVLSLLFIAFILQFKFKLTKEKYLLLWFWSIFSFIYFIGIFKFKTSSYFYLIDNIYFIMSIYLVILLSNLKVLQKVVFLVFAWGLFLSLWHLTLGINYREELGQHYLTLSMPMGAALSYSLSFLFIKMKLLKRIFYLISFLIILTALSTLLSRSVFIFTAFIAFISIFSFIFINKEIKYSKKLILVFVLFAIISILYFLIIDFLEFRQAYRFVRLLEETSSEPRAISYIRDFNYILENPFVGYGTNSYSTIVGGIYPHNIFLEIIFFGGLLLLLPFLAILFLYVKYILKAFKAISSNIHIFGAVVISLFYFFQFNSSFSLKGSYIAIGSIVLFIVGYGELINKNTIKGKK